MLRTSTRASSASSFGSTRPVRSSSPRHGPCPLPLCTYLPAHHHLHCHRAPSTGISRRSMRPRAPRLPRCGQRARQSCARTPVRSRQRSFLLLLPGTPLFWRSVPRSSWGTHAPPCSHRRRERLYGSCRLGACALPCRTCPLGCQRVLCSAHPGATRKHGASLRDAHPHVYPKQSHLPPATEGPKRETRPLAICAAGRYSAAALCRGCSRCKKRLRSRKMYSLRRRCAVPEPRLMSPLWPYGPEHSSRHGVRRLPLKGFRAASPVTFGAVCDPIQAAAFFDVATIE